MQKKIKKNIMPSDTPMSHFFYLLPIYTRENKDFSPKINKHCLVYLFDLILHVPSTIFQLYRDEFAWVEPVLSSDKCVLLKNHNAVTLGGTNPRSFGLKSSTLPQRSLNIQVGISQDLGSKTENLSEIF